MSALDRLQLLARSNVSALLGRDGGDLSAAALGDDPRGAGARDLEATYQDTLDALDRLERLIATAERHAPDRVERARREHTKLSRRAEELRAAREAAFVRPGGAAGPRAVVAPASPAPSIDAPIAKTDKLRARLDAVGDAIDGEAARAEIAAELDAIVHGRAAQEAELARVTRGARDAERLSALDALRDAPPLDAAADAALERLRKTMSSR